MGSAAVSVPVSAMVWSPSKPDLIVSAICCSSESVCPDGAGVACSTGADAGVETDVEAAGVEGVEALTGVDAGAEDAAGAAAGAEGIVAVVAINAVQISIKRKHVKPVLTMLRN